MNRDVSTARAIYRSLRKKAKRAWSHVLLAALRVRSSRTTAAVTGDVPVIVSLTSYGTRVATVSETIESIAAGSVRPQRLILWLDDPEILSSLPTALQRLVDRGLEVRKCDDLGPHKKYFPVLHLSSAENLRVVTADDDTLYPRRWLERLWEAHVEQPEVVHCYRASLVTVTRGQIDPYSTWPRCKDSEATAHHFATGVSGVIYPAAMIEALSARGRAFEELCPRADDIWLHWVALRSGILVRQVSITPRHFPYIPGSQEVTLVKENVEHGGNDRWIQALYTAADVSQLSAAARQSSHS